MKEYKTTRKKISLFIENEIIPVANERNLDYNKLISIAVIRFGISKKIVMEVLDSFIDSGIFLKEKVNEEKTIKLNPNYSLNGGLDGLY